MEKLFKEICLEKGAEHLLEEVKINTLQESMQAVNHIRAIVEVCPRGQALDRVCRWREVVQKAIEVFGV